MKNKIKNVSEFKDRIKLLYEYKIHDLNLNKEESVYHMSEDEQQPQEQPKPVQEPTPAPKPVEQPQEPTPAPKPAEASIEQPKPVQEPIPAPKQVDSGNDFIMNYLRGELEKLTQVVDKIDKISNDVNIVSQRLDTLTKSVDEVKEPSDIEKLEMRSLDSYPYNNTLTKVWNDKLKTKEEQDYERMGIYKTNDGYEMEFIPNKTPNFNSVNKQF